MKVGTTTMAATTQGFAAPGLAANAASVICRRPPGSRSNRRLADAAVGLQKLPGIGSGRRLIDIDVRNNRRADEQRVLSGS